MTPEPSRRRPDPSWLTAAQAAARLGVKPATLYAYVSRGHIPRHRGSDGRTSYFAPADVEKLARRTPHSRLAPTDIVVPTSISLVDGRNGMLWYRGVDAVAASRTRRFESVAEFLWTGRWTSKSAWRADPACVRAAVRASRALPRSTRPVDRVAVIVGAARSADSARADRSTAGATTTGRNLLAVIVDALPPLGPDIDATQFAAKLWARVSPLKPSRDEIRLLDTVLGLGAEHGVTFSVIAARLAASAGADPYACVGAALGPALASIEHSRFPAIEALFEECERTGDADRAVEASAAREPTFLGVSSEPYVGGDPRATPTLESVRIVRPDRAATVDAAAAALTRISGGRPDMTFALAATSYALGLAPGSSELICAVARIAGWIAHAIGEYRRPTPFRPHATYIGTSPSPEQREERKMLHAVMNYLRED